MNHQSSKYFFKEKGQTFTCSHECFGKNCCLSFPFQEALKYCLYCLFERETDGQKRPENGTEITFSTVSNLTNKK